MLVRAVQLRKALFPMLSAVSEITTFRRLVSLLNISEGISFIPPGILTSVSLGQFENAPEPISSTPSAMFTVLRLLHLLNAYDPIDITDDGIETLIILLQL